MIQAYYKYRPASIETLALLVYADGKDRLTQVYFADLLRGLMLRRPPAELPPRLPDVLNAKPRPKTTAAKASGFVDELIRTFGKGGKK